MPLTLVILMISVNYSLVLEISRKPELISELTATYEILWYLHGLSSVYNIL